MTVHAGHGGRLNLCTEPQCVEHVRRYLKRWRHMKHNGVQLTLDSAPARLHIATLTGMGWTLRSIAGAAGLAPQTIYKLNHGQATVRPKVLAAVLGVDPSQIPSKPASDSREEYHVTLARHQGLCTRPECDQKAGVALLCNRCRYAKAKGMIS